MGHQRSRLFPQAEAGVLFFASRVAALARAWYNGKRDGVRGVYFSYGDRETEYLRRKDKRLGAVIERVGHIERAVDPDLFSAVVHHIVGQQVSMRAQATIWRGCGRALGEVSAQTVEALDAEALQGMGMSAAQGGIHPRLRAPRAERRIRPRSRAAHGRWAGHRRAHVAQGRWAVDGGDDLAVLPSAAGRAQLRRSRHPAAACACSIATSRSTASASSATAAAIRPVAAWPASTSGRSPAARSRD